MCGQDHVRPCLYTPALPGERPVEAKAGSSHGKSWMTPQTACTTETFRSDRCYGKGPTQEGLGRLTGISLAAGIWIPYAVGKMR